MAMPVSLHSFGVNSDGIQPACVFFFILTVLKIQIGYEVKRCLPQFICQCKSEKSCHHLEVDKTLIGLEYAIIIQCIEFSIVNKIP